MISDTSSNSKCIKYNSISVLLYEFYFDFIYLYYDSNLNYELH